MSIEIRTATSRRDLKTFVAVPFDLYRDHPLWVPPLIRDELDTFNPNRNPAYEHAETRLFVAYADGRPVGRIAAVLSHVANRKYGTRNMRFGWFDSIEDGAVAQALFGAVEAWARERGMETLTGPHGFCDLDPQGMLIDGFDQLPTIAVYYNYPYYNELVERCGFTKEVDYVEYLTPVPHDTGIPEKLLRITERVRQRSRLRLLKFKSKREMLARAPELFRLLDETFAEIYGAVPLTQAQMDYYVKKYFSFLDKNLVQVAVNEDDEMVAFMFAMPSLSRGFQRAHGRLFPFGWWHILRALREHDILDFYLAGVRERYRGQGIDLLMVMEFAKIALARGYRVVESNPELETNEKIQAQWKPFNPTLHKRRRIYRKQIVATPN